MPIHRRSPPQRSTSDGSLLNDLVAELKQPRDMGQPIIIEDSTPETHSLRVNVVWDRWEECPRELRAGIIIDAYKEARGEEVRQQITLALGVTVPEAVAIGLLPFHVRCVSRLIDKLVPKKEFRKTLVNAVLPRSSARTGCHSAVLPWRMRKPHAAICSRPCQVPSGLSSKKWPILFPSKTTCDMKWSEARYLDTMRNARSTQLLFELAKPGLQAARLPECDVPRRPLEELLPPAALAAAPPPLPELAEPDVVRHFVNLSTQNMAVDTHFYPLGSCTMKYNPKRNERLAGLPGMAALHPYQPEDDVAGLAGVALRVAANAGRNRRAAGRFAPAGGRGAGRADVRCWWRPPTFAIAATAARVVLIPDGAHGTNPASASVGRLSHRAGQEHRGRFRRPGRPCRKARRPDVAVIMITNPNTLGMFERHMPQIARMVHGVGGLVVSGRGEHERHPGHHPARRFRRRPDALQSAQDVQRPARRRRTGGRADRRGRRARPYLPAPSSSQDERRLPARLRSAQVDRPRAELLRQHGRAGAHVLLPLARTALTGCGAWPKTRC